MLQNKKNKKNKNIIKKNNKNRKIRFFEKRILLTLKKRGINI